MTVEIAIVLAFVMAAVILFTTEKLPVDLVSIMVMVGLIISGVISGLPRSSRLAQASS